MPSQTPYDNPFERTQLALDATLRGNLGLAGRAAFSPSSVSPEERKTWVDRWLGGEPGLLHSVLDTVSNPFVLMGLALSLRFPIAKATEMMNFGGRLKNYSRVMFPGLRYINDFHETFKGTPLPQVMEHVTQTTHLTGEFFRGKVNKAIEAFEGAGGRYTADVGRRVSAYLDGLHLPDKTEWGMLQSVSGVRLKNPPTLQLSAAEKSLASEIHGIFKTQFRDTFADEGAVTAVKGKLRALGFEPPKDLRKALDVATPYFPHIESLTPAEMRDRFKQWIGQYGAAGAKVRKVMGEAPARQVSKRVVSRKNAMLPDLEDLRRLGMATPEVEKAYQLADFKWMEEYGRPVRRYSLDLARTASSYIQSLARTKAWDVPAGPGVEPAHRIIMREMQTLAKESPVKASMMSDVYIPMATGQLTWEQAVPSMAFADQKLKAVEVLDRMDFLPKTLRETLKRPLEESSSPSLNRVGSKIAGYIYNSTLSLNLVSPVKNLGQSLLTTVPTIGVKYTVQGMEETIRRASQYRNLINKGLTPEKAFQTAFKEFYNTGYDFKGLSEFDKMMSIVERGATQIGPRRAISKGLDQLQEKGLWLFTTSERFNRLSAFYGARAKALKELPGSMWSHFKTGNQAVLLEKGSPYLEAAASDFGDQVMRMTQFGGGPLGAPYFTLKGPISWAPVRQFMQFPSRMLGFAAGPGTSLGGGGGFNPGTLGRMMLGSGLAYEGGKHLFDTDLSNSLMFGAMPEFGDPEHSPFGITPMVAPALQIVGAGISSAVKGDLDDLKHVAPLLVPGGVGLSRLAPALGSPTISGALAKPYADYNARTPDGRIPVYKPNGQLIGYYSGMQLFAKAAGLGDLDSAKEVALMKYMIGQRDRIRGFRRNWLDSTLSGDTVKADQIQAEYQRAYPGLGKLEIKQKDIRDAQARREIPRLQRLLDTLPPDARQQLAQVVAVSMASRGPTFLTGAGNGGVRAGTSNSSRGAQPLGATGGLSSMLRGASEQRQTAVQSGEQVRDSINSGFTQYDGF